MTLNINYWHVLPSVIYLLSVAMFVTSAIVLYWPTPEFALLSDQSPVSWLSSAQLWALALLALRLGMERVLPIGIAIWLGLAMVALACDEQFMLHEQWKYGCTAWWSACGMEWVTELPMMLVGGLGLLTLLALHRNIQPRPARILMWSGFTVGAVALTLDLITWSDALSRYEEGLEVLSETLFTASLLGLHATQKSQEHSE
jgi:hypothetical protein